MYTISMRPDTPSNATNKCANFEQERTSWALSTFSEFVESDAGGLGVAFYSPLENVDITVVQLAAMIAGLDTAYDELCDTIYAEASTALAATPFQTVEMFMECIPRGFLESEPTDYSTAVAPDVKPVPLLYNAERGTCLVWTGKIWGTVDPPSDIDTYDSAGACFGWDVRYSESVMSTDCVRDSDNLCAMLGKLLGTLGWLSNDAKVYVKNLYSVQ